MTRRGLKIAQREHRQDILVLQSLGTDWKAVGELSNLVGLRHSDVGMSIHRLAKAKRALLYWDTTPRLGRDGRPARGGRWLAREPY